MNTQRSLRYRRGPTLGTGHANPNPLQRGAALPRRARLASGSPASAPRKRKGPHQGPNRRTIGSYEGGGSRRATEAPPHESVIEHLALDRERTRPRGVAPAAALPTGRHESSGSVAGGADSQSNDHPGVMRKRLGCPAILRKDPTNRAERAHRWHTNSPRSRKPP